MERGTHESLLALNGAYTRLYDLQLREQEEFETRMLSNDNKEFLQEEEGGNRGQGRDKSVPTGDDVYEEKGRDKLVPTEAYEQKREVRR